MIDEAVASIPIWMLMSAAVGYMMGEAVGDSRRHRKCLEQTNDDLHAQLEKAHPGDSLHKELKQQRGVINDIHKHVVALSKALNRPTAK